MKNNFICKHQYHKNCIQNESELINECYLCVKDDQNQDDLLKKLSIENQFQQQNCIRQGQKVLITSIADKSLNRIPLGDIKQNLNDIFMQNSISRQIDQYESMRDQFFKNTSLSSIEDFSNNNSLINFSLEINKSIQNCINEYLQNSFSSIFSQGSEKENEPDFQNKINVKFDFQEQFRNIKLEFSSNLGISQFDLNDFDESFRFPVQLTLKDMRDNSKNKNIKDQKSTIDLVLIIACKNKNSILSKNDNYIKTLRYIFSILKDNDRFAILISDQNQNIKDQSQINCSNVQIFHNLNVSCQQSRDLILSILSNQEETQGEIQIYGAIIKSIEILNKRLYRNNYSQILIITDQIDDQYQYQLTKNLCQQSMLVKDTTFSLNIISCINDLTGQMQEISQIFAGSYIFIENTKQIKQGLVLISQKIQNQSLFDICIKLDKNQSHDIEIFGDQLQRINNYQYILKIPQIYINQKYKFIIWVTLKNKNIFDKVYEKIRLFSGFFNQFIARVYANDYTESMNILKPFLNFNQIISDSLDLYFSRENNKSPFIPKIYLQSYFRDLGFCLKKTLILAIKNLDDQAIQMIQDFENNMEQEIQKINIHNKDLLIYNYLQKIINNTINNYENKDQIQKIQNLTNCLVLQQPYPSFNLYLFKNYKQSMYQVKKSFIQ